LDSAARRLRDHPDLLRALDHGLPPLGEHAEMFRFVSAVNRDVSQGLAAAISSSVDRASFTGLFDAIAGVLAQQFVLLPYYFAVFHQNKERHLVRQITTHPLRPPAAATPAPPDTSVTPSPSRPLLPSPPSSFHLALFTDTL